MSEKKEKTWIGLYFREDLQQVLISQSTPDGECNEIDLRRDYALAIARAILAYYGFKSDST